MAEEAQYSKDHGVVTLTATAAIASGEVRQLPDGRAGVYTGLNAGASGDEVGLRTQGQYKINKSTSVVFLPGQEVWWDASNNQATYEVAGDFFVGTCVEDTTAAATTVMTDMNVRRAVNTIEVPGNGVDYATTETSGAPIAQDNGGAIKLAFDTTAEAQRAEALSEASVEVASDWIAEFTVNVADNGDDAALDFNVGMANAGHASDADAITEAIFIHLDGNSLDLKAESDDGTTEVAATDTTVDCVEDADFFVQIDGRDPSDCQIYVNGALVLSGSTFDISDATGPLKFLAHLEKSSNDTPGEVRVRNVRVYKSPSV